MTNQIVSGNKAVMPSLNSTVELFVSVKQVADFSWPLPLYMAQLTLLGEAPKSDWRHDIEILVFASHNGQKFEVSQLLIPRRKWPKIPVLVSLTSHHVIEWLDKHESYSRRQKDHLVAELREAIQLEINQVPRPS